MPNRQQTLPPLALYIHIPWCIRKCPYCDFNSHQRQGELPVDAYLKSLIADLEQEAERARGRPLTSIFFGGGTPSLFPASAINEVLCAARQSCGFDGDIEITLEANPGAAEYTNLSGLRASGVNRLSFGVQSFDDAQLRALGRVHGRSEALSAFYAAREAGFDNINIDLMHGLPEQDHMQACADLEQAIALAPEHISWYQLTIEANTAFYSAPPILPHENMLANIQDRGAALLQQHGYRQYEVSAYSKEGRQSRHNLNYWQFGDYLAIGAGAHGKVTDTEGRVWRYRKTRKPEDYLAINKDQPFVRGLHRIEQDELALEFMMNALRLCEGINLDSFEQRTGLSVDTIRHKIDALCQQGLLCLENGTLHASALGLTYLDSVLAEFQDLNKGQNTQQ